MRENRFRRFRRNGGKFGKKYQVQSQGRPPPTIGVTRGCNGCTRAPPRAEKNLGAKFTGKSFKCIPRQCMCTPRQSKSIFLGNWEILTVGASGYWLS